MHQSKKYYHYKNQNEKYTIAALLCISYFLDNMHSQNKSAVFGIEKSCIFEVEVTRNASFQVFSFFVILNGNGWRF